MAETTIATRLFRGDASLCYLPEGPYPLGPSQISWVAIQHGLDSKQGSLNRLNLETGENQSSPLPGRPGFAFPCDDQRHFVVGCERELGVFDPETASWQVIAESIDGDVENTIINDGVVFEDHLIFGTKDLEFATKKAGLYLFRGRDHVLTRLRDDQICSNGKAVYRAGDTCWLLDIDSPTRRIVRYAIDWETATLSEPTTVLDLTGDEAVPDGMLQTPDGRGVIVSMFNPNHAEYGQTRWYDLSSGALLHTWQTPGAPRNTCPQLVSHGGQVKLVITTAIEGMSDAELAAAPESGSLFIADTPFTEPSVAPAFPIKALSALLG